MPTRPATHNELREAGVVMPLFSPPPLEVVEPLERDLVPTQWESGADPRSQFWIHPWEEDDARNRKSEGESNIQRSGAVEVRPSRRLVLGESTSANTSVPRRLRHRHRGL